MKCRLQQLNFIRPSVVTLAQSEDVNEQVKEPVFFALKKVLFGQNASHVCKVKLLSYEAM
jgi:hypothetical protein